MTFETRTQAVTLTGLLVASITLLLLVGCGGGANNEEKTLLVAQAWTASTTEAVVSAIVDLVIGNVPVAPGFASDKITEQVNKRLAWDYSDPQESSGNIYRVTATASTEVSIEVPLLGSKTYQAVLPFDLQVDVEAESVKDWAPVLSAATVGEK